jgi:hypothetical protein
VSGKVGADKALEDLVRTVHTWRKARFQDDNDVAEMADRYVRHLEAEAENPGADKFAALANRKVTP